MTSKAISVGIVYDKIYLRHSDVVGTHPESPSRLIKIMYSLEGLSLLKKVSVIKPEKAPLEAIYSVHDREYVELIKNTSSESFKYIDSDTYVNKWTYTAALYAAGGTIKAIEATLAGNYLRVFALVRPPGHHAGIRGSALGAPTLGFCIFNNVAIGAKYLLSKGFKKIAIVDIDVHHGNGAQEIFWTNPYVLHIDIHQRGIYPGTGSISDVGGGDAAGTKVNIPLDYGAGDITYSILLTEIIEPLISEFKPDYILVSAGFDAHHSDHLAGLSLTARGYYEIFSRIVKLADRYCGGKLVAVLEGGYRDGLTKGVPNAIAALMGVDPLVTEDEVPDTYGSKVHDLISRMRRVLNVYWRLG
ncbi:MAG: histone deacetylase [Desulfurococcales archaeon]|nr:histone deacetylase [Desulfurococcales archaeon]